MMFRIRSLSLKLTFFLVILGCTGLPLVTLSLSFVPGVTYKFAYKTDTNINELHGLLSQSRSDKQNVEVRLLANVEVMSMWSDDNHNFIRLTANGVSIESQSRFEPTKVEQLFKSPAFFLLEKGLIVKSFVAEEHKLSSNLYRGIASLFQFNEHNLGLETDASGVCEVKYDKISNHKSIKSKKNCHNPDALEYFNVNELLGVRRHAWSQTEYSFSDDFVLSIKSHESHEVASTLGNMAMIATSSQQLSLLEAIQNQNEVIGSLDEAINKIRRDFSKLVESSMMLSSEGEECRLNCKKLSTVIEDLSSKVTPSSTGREGSSLAFQVLVKAFRAANQIEVTQLMKAYKHKEAIFLILIDAACAAQTSSTLSSLKEVLDFKKDKVQVLERFLLGASLSTHPSQELLIHLLELSSLKFPNVELSESILGSLGAVIFTYTKSPNHDKHTANKSFEALMKHLSDCGDETSCQATTIRALSNAGAWNSVETIMQVAESSKEAVVGEACLKALRRFDVQYLRSKFGDRLKDIFHQRRRGFDTVVRSQALKLLLKMELEIEEIREIFKETLDPWNTNYSLYVQSLLFNEARKIATFGERLNVVMRNATLNNYHTLSPKGKSLAFSSEMFDSPRVEYLMYVENGRSGAMRRSGMDVDVQTFNLSLPLYKFEIFAAGLGSFLGEGNDESEDSDVTAGMSLDMMGVSLRPITFFVGQGGLMSAIWSAPSELVPALQINFLLQDHKESVFLGNGFMFKIEVIGAVSLELSGSLSVSLWNKNARSLVRNSGSLTLKSSGRLETNLFYGGLEMVEEMQSGVDFKTDVDFYDEVKMCLQMLRPTSSLRQQIITHEWLIGSQKSFIARRSTRTTLPGISYPLPRANDDMCRKLFPSQ